MSKNTTRHRILRTGKPKNPSLKTNRRKTPAGLTTNYGMILQLYCLNKKDATIRKGLKYEKLVSRKSIRAASKPSYSIPAMIVSLLNESILLLKKVRPGVAMITE